MLLLRLYGRHCITCGVNQDFHFLIFAVFFIFASIPHCRCQQEEELLKERLCEHEGCDREALAGPFGLHVQTSQAKGRGVFTKTAICSGQFVIGAFSAQSRDSKPR
jgi:hypothetical protein